MTFVFALSFTLMVLLASYWRGEGIFLAMLLGLGLGAWLTALIEKRIRRIAGDTPRATAKADEGVYAALEDIHWRLKRLEAEKELGPSPLEADTNQPPAAEDIAKGITEEPAEVGAIAPANPWQAESAAASRSAASVVPSTASSQTPIPPNPIELLVERFRTWLLGGNTVVRVGIVVLFFGVAFLLKFAAEHAVLPLELRVAGIGAGAIVLLALGWRLRTRREAYALALQGAGVGLLYLTLFGAFRLYHLVPPALALAAMVAVSGLSALLALLQNSRALIAIGVSGGFLAPILASTGNGSHVALFSYYTVLNLGIFAVAWFKAWRPLNLLGFFFTFSIGLLWGSSAYRPEFFTTTEPFLLLFFTLFLAISILFAQRQSESLGDWLSEVAEGRLPKRNAARRIVDSTLVFGLPLVGFGLQAGLTRDLPYALAFSALALSALYLSLARWLHGRGYVQLQLLVESFLALGVIFATLVIPLALDARWTSASWALEGAALIWVGTHQQRRLARAFGLLLQFAAAVAWLIQPGLWAGSVVPVLNARCTGAILIALAALFSAWQLQKWAAKVTSLERRGALLVLAWGLVWWLIAGLGEADRLLPAPLFDSFSVFFLAASATLLALFAEREDWPQGRLPVAGLVLALGYVFLHELWRGQHVLGAGGWLAWPTALLCHYWRLRAHDDASHFPRWSPRAHALGLWLLAGLGSHELYWLATQLELGGGWTAAALVVVPALLLAALCRAQAAPRWPLQAQAPSYLGWGAFPLLAALALWSLLTDLSHDGNPAPLTYLPLLNPLDLGQVLIGLVALQWARTVRNHIAQIGVPPDTQRWSMVLGLLVFLWLNAVLLRSLHYWAAIPFAPRDMLQSVLVQAALSLFWTVLALALMVAGARRGARALWMTGAGLMAVVVLKLFLVDLDNVGSVARIVSFTGVGLLMLVIGYLAPVPPKTADASTSTSTREP